jgi:hypothetical protein
VSVLPPAPQIPQNVLSPLQQIALRSGLTLEQILAEAPVEPTFRKTEEVPDDSELKRIKALPSREPPVSSPDAATLAAFLTSRLARTANPYPGSLNGVQSVFLKELWENKRAIGPIKAGGGKTLLSFLIPHIIGAKRPVYMAPPALKEGVRREWRKYAVHWHGPHVDNYTFLSYKILGLASAGPQLDAQGRVLRASLLDRLAPDCIVADEAQYLKNRSASVTKKVKRYLEAHPECIFIPLSGTLMRRSVKEMSHLFDWALKQGSPIPSPKHFHTLEAWADHLDEKQSFGPRADVGALRVFFTDTEKAQFASTVDDEDKRNISRAAVGRRIVTTPGVISTQDGPLGIPLAINSIYPPKEDPKIAEFFTAIRSRWELPDGQVIVDGKDLARHAKCIGLGYWLKWRTRPPESWLQARSEWAKFARRVCQNNRRGIDSEKAVVDNIKTGLINDFGLHENWISERDALRKKTGELFPPTVEEILSDEPLEYAAEWAAREKGIIWVLNTRFGARLADAVGTAFYAERGLDKAGNFVEDHPKDSPIVLSYSSNKEGRNLQFKWSRGLWLGATPEEQSLARCHRLHQEADDVVNTVWIGAREHAAAFWSQVGAAQTTQKIQQQAQRLCYADVTVDKLEDVEARKSARYVK